MPNERRPKYNPNQDLVRLSGVGIGDEVRILPIRGGGTPWYSSAVVTEIVKTAQPNNPIVVVDYCNDIQRYAGGTAAYLVRKA